MKKLFTLLFWLVSFFAAAQTVDTAGVIKEVDSLLDLSKHLIQNNNCQDAMSNLELSRKLIIENLGSEDTLYATYLLLQGGCIQILGQYEEAEKFYLKAKDLREKMLGKKHPDYGRSLYYLGVFYSQMHRFKESEDFLLAASAVLENAFGKSSPEIEKIRDELAYVYHRTGRFVEAEKILLDIMPIREKLYGKKSNQYLNSLSTLSALYYDMKMYNKAEQSMLEFKSLNEATFGKNSTQYAGSLSDLGLLYWGMGRYEEAESYFTEALPIMEMLQGIYREHYAGTLINTGLLNYSLKKYKRAEQLYLEAKKIFETEINDTEHPFYLNCISNLADVYARTGRFAEAEPLYFKSLELTDKIIGKEHPDYAITLHNLAKSYFELGRMEEAEHYFKEAIIIRETHLGKKHPDYLESITEYSTMLFATGRGKEAIPSMIEGSALLHEWLIAGSQYLTEEELTPYIRRVAGYFDIYLSHASSFSQSTGKLPAVCFDNSLFYKGFLLASSQQIKNLALADTVFAKALNLLKSYRQNLAAEYAKPIVEQKGIEELEEKSNTLEKELVRTIAGFGEALRQVTWQEVQAQLMPGEAAIEFVRYKHYLSKPTDSTLYSALILRPGDHSPHFVTLCEAKALDALVSQTNVRQMEYVETLYAPPGSSDKSLYELIWSPLQPLLKDVKTVYYSPSGLLHSLNLSAIAINENTILTDRHDLVALGSTRQLVISSTPTAAISTAVIYGGIQYDMDSTEILKANSELESDPVSTRGIPGFSPADSTLRSGELEYLPWTETEAANIQSILSETGIPAEIRKGYNATEESFKHLGKGNRSPRILHISTHGFFFPDPKETVNNSALGVEGEPTFKISDHPMIRSGLIFAGASHAWKTGKPLKPDLEDGILTAYEISQLDLRNTELVVLSACETGLGDIEGNEGVYGLQRAFKIAGVKNLIMSLWQVPDRQTQELMTDFYHNWLVEKMPVRKALQTAQQKLREKGLEPYYWAGFVLVE